MKAVNERNARERKGPKTKGERMADGQRKIDSETVRKAAKLAIDLHRDALKELERR